MEASRRQLDTALETPAPEYIVFRHALAGPATRFVAALIDQFVLTGGLLLIILGLLVIFGISGLAAFESGSALLIFLILMALFAFNWFYFVLMEWFTRGRTVGKLALGLRVVSLDGSALRFSQTALRNLLRVADMMPAKLFVGGGQIIPIYAAGALAMILNARTFQRLGDLSAGTIVIRDRKRDVIFSPPPPPAHIESLAERLNPRILPSPTLAQALNDFVHRRSRLHPDRAAEIARAVEPELRRIFGATQIPCDAVDLLIAAQTRMFRLSREAAASLQLTAGRSPLQQLGAKL
ncbi:MAG: RDD family protein [Leptospirales bacterium]|nr:RDD family protein [Leptospirales bacterium]